jgi:hypothetical protein
MDSGEEGRALSVIRTGLDMHDEGETSFWDEFISLCGNSDGMAELLGIGRDKITSWPSRVREMLEKAQRANSEDPSQKDQTEMIPTGSNGAITMNADPNLGGLT